MNRLTAAKGQRGDPSTAWKGPAESKLIVRLKALAYELNLCASWYTMVGMMCFRRLASSNCREQKKLAPKIVCGSELVYMSKWSATVHAMVDLPEPAWPVNQNTDGLSCEELTAAGLCALVYPRSPSTLFTS